MDFEPLLAGDAPVADLRGRSFSRERIRDALLAAGWLALDVDCDGLATAGGVFSAFAAALGRDYFASNWDAFEDALKSLPYGGPRPAGYALLLANYAGLLSGDPAGAALFLDSLSGADASLRANHGLRLKTFLF